MSLILDALKKLEREKQTTPRGFLVVAPSGWAGQGRGAALVGASLAVGLVLGAVGLAAYFRVTRAERGAPAVTEQAAPALAQAAPAPPSITPAPPSLTAPPLAAAARPRSAPPPAQDRAAPPPALASSDRPAGPSPVPAAVQAHEDGPRLQAISEQDGHPVAVIDERLVREGEEVNGMKILHIGAAEVEIEHLGRRRILRF